MELLIVNDYAAMSYKAAQFLASQVILKPECVMGLATGSTPEGLYKELVKMFQMGLIDFEKVTAFNLDEYVGLEAEHPQGYKSYMYNHFFKHVNIDPTNRHIPDGNAEKLDAECEAYDYAIKRAGGIDIQVLGIGRNGHIGFNEPDLKFEAETHVVALDEKTIRDNARFFTAIEQVPRYAISMGVKTIMQARKIILLASGKEKAEAVYGMLYGDITPTCPASVLQLHPNVTVICDFQAAALLKK